MSGSGPFRGDGVRARTRRITEHFIGDFYESCLRDGMEFQIYEKAEMCLCALHRSITSVCTSFHFGDNLLADDLLGTHYSNFIC